VYEGDESSQALLNRCSNIIPSTHSRASIAYESSPIAYEGDERHPGHKQCANCNRVSVHEQNDEVAIHRPRNRTLTRKSRRCYKLCTSKLLLSSV
jgi:hypothetical protein